MLSAFSRKCVGVALVGLLVGCATSAPPLPPEKDPSKKKRQVLAQAEELLAEMPKAQGKRTDIVPAWDEVNE